ncbi:hypothetical protein [Flagellimonas pacifica]|uniref:Uncharacterized protein n=1 Tax=Flagellimonas pacifica TaxID=1247520 RepID=A0A285MUL6_9FLAO|nr:hypothetical protein [Allomuricauda parva]SNZ00808.1 hypothetical protein SAMN06265377_2634 [Allomuricauda parva]
MRYFSLKASALFFLLTLVVGCGKQDKTIMDVGGFEIGIDRTGALIKLTDGKNNVDYAFVDVERQPIMSIQVNGKLEQPTSCEFDSNTNRFLLKYSEDAILAEIEIANKEDYITFELVSISNPDKVELVTWGPYRTTIGKTIGETVGVVRNDTFAIGLQSLNMRTLGGYPTDDDISPEFDIFSTTSLLDVSDSLKILYRGHTALPKRYGSNLQAYTRNRKAERVIENMHHHKYTAPSYEDEGVMGSKIALFGCQPKEVLNTLEKIEIEEGLPHPKLDGVWAKKSPLASSAYLIQNFSVSNIDKAIALTKKAGLKYLYHSDPFENWGHFDLKKEDFPENWESMKSIVEKAAAQDIQVGVHTLSNFITPNDPYVTSIPDERLAKVGSDFLVNSIDDKEKDIEIKDPSFFNQMNNNNLHAVVIGKEIIRYESVSEFAPWILKNCSRGAFGTTSAAHEQGARISKLADHAYRTFLTNTELSVEMGEKLAQLYNKTGLRQISFDGLEGNHSTGMGTYGQLLFTHAWYDNLESQIKDDYVMDASRSGHYFWHSFTRMNWGEPWYDGFRESQTLYRILNQDYFRRNYIPGMLGWFAMRENTSIEDIEWMLARSAAFDAGYALVTSAEIIDTNGFGDEALEQIKQWEKARISGAFSSDQKKRMENIEKEFTLETVSGTEWNLIPYAVERFEHLAKTRQPGEPVWTNFAFNNEHEEQTIKFILSTKNGGSASGVTMEINNFKKVHLNVVIGPNQFLKYNGGNEAILYNATWNKIKSIPIDQEKLIIGTGEQKIKVDCHFSPTEDTSLKLEIRTAGTPERVKKL